MRSFVSLLLAVVFSAQLALAQEAPRAGDFEVLNYRYSQIEGTDSINIIGSVRNNSEVAGSPRMQATAWDSDGVPLSTVVFWPSIDVNVPPGETRPFTNSLHHVNEQDIAVFTITIDSVNVWAR